MNVTLIITSPDGTRQFPWDGERLTIGRTDQAALVINDEGLSRLHASFNRDGERIWILDERSTNGTYVNGEEASATGTLLRDGDEISIGNHTTIRLAFNSAQAAAATPGANAAQAPAPSATTQPKSGRLFVFAAVFAIVIFSVAALAVGARFLFGGDRREIARAGGKSPRTTKAATGDDLDLFGDASPTPGGPEKVATSESTTSSADGRPDGVTATPSSSATPLPSAEFAFPATPIPLATSNSGTGTPRPTGVAGGANSLPPTQSTQTALKRYAQMSASEQTDFVEKRAQHVSMMMGNRPYAFTPEALDWIKRYVDGYARRVGNNSTRLWGEDMRFMFLRARTQYSPHIVRAFNARGVPPVVGLYLCVVETEYHNIESENFAGAAGLFQFIGPTAEAYGVPRAERTNVEKMAPAAAAYIAHRMTEFGSDSMSVALGIAGYNRNPDSVRRDLRDVLNSENKERSFWTLIVNSTKLDHFFQGENIKYVPKFFAAAIVGENPLYFGIEMNPLSTYTDLPSAATQTPSPPPPPLPGATPAKAGAPAT